MFIQITDPLAPSIPAHKETDIYAIGIDLGTTHCVAAIAYTETDIRMIPLGDHILMPSRVAYDPDGGVHIGQQAQSFQNIFSSFKRLMDRPINPIRTSDDDSNVTPLSLSVQLLSAIKEYAEKFTQTSVTHAVITVPAYFDETARQATKDAAHLAGLTVLRLINEPTAAALAYGLDQFDSTRSASSSNQHEACYLVYDLGGGTFDVSLLKMKQGVFQVIATGGDVQLGGDDIDAAIIACWAENNPNSSPDLRTQYARLAKEYLSDHHVFECNGLKLTRAALDQLVMPFLVRTKEIMMRVLHDANMSSSDIDGIILVGGATRMPAIREMIKQSFCHDPLIDLDPDLIVAQGAALQARMLTHGHGTLLLDVTPLSLGLEMMGGIVERLIQRNSPIPISVTQEFTTYENHQTAIAFHVVQGEREFADDCRSLARFVLTDIPAMPAGVARVQVTFTLDIDGLLSVEAVDALTHNRQHVVVRPSYGLSEDELHAMLHQSHMHGAHDIIQRQLVEARIDAKRLLEYCQSAILRDGYLLEQDEMACILRACRELEQAIASNDRNTIIMCRDQLKAVTASFATQRMNHAIQQKFVGQHV